MPKFSVILPTYNEKNNIIVLVNKLFKLYASTRFEILIIDDNSPDRTYEIAKKKFYNRKNVKCFKRQRNRGLANSIGYGLKKAKGEFIIVMDTDLTHDPKLIKNLLYINSVYDIVSCSRYCSGGSMENKKHFMGSYIYNLILRIILKTQIQDNLGGFFSIKREILKEIPHNKVFYGYGEYFFRLLHYAQQRKLSIIEIPAYYKNRTDGVSKSRFFVMFFSYFLSAIKLRLIKN